MTTVYELINLLPSTFVPCFAPRLNALLLFLKEREPMTEKEATEKYLKDTNRIKYFNKLKNELKTALTRYVIVNPSWTNLREKALYEDCYANVSIYKILLLSYKRKAALDIAKPLLLKLLKLELHSFAYIVANDLLFHYSCIEVAPKLARKYEKILETQFELTHAESIISKYHYRIGLIGNTRSSFTKANIKEFIEATEQVLPFLRLKSSHLHRLIYSIVVSRYIIVYDYENIIKYCDKALASFPKDHPNGQSLRFAFIHKKVPALAALGRLKEAKALAKSIGRMVPKGNFNWHLALSKRVIICFRSGDYQEAYELYKAHAAEKCLSKTMQEYWEIIRGYLYFLIEAGKIKKYADEKFSLGKFINEVPIYSRDKAGNNINILIIQILILIQRGHYSRIIDWVESLRAYARTYTRNPETIRANIFINMIIKMEAAYFHRSGTERITQKLYRKLLDTPLKSGQNLAVEIVPLEVLWEETLNMLDNKIQTIKIKESFSKR